MTTMSTTIVPHVILPAANAPVRRIFGIPIHAVGMEQALGICGGSVENRTRLVVGMVNAAKIVNMQRQPVLHDSVVASDLVLADGMAVVWACRLLRQAVPERVAGIDLFERLLGLADR